MHQLLRYQGEISSLPRGAVDVTAVHDNRRPLVRHGKEPCVRRAVVALGESGPSSPTVTDPRCVPHVRCVEDRSNVTLGRLPLDLETVVRVGKAGLTGAVCFRHTAALLFRQHFAHRDVEVAECHCTIAVETGAVHGRQQHGFQVGERTENLAGPSVIRNVVGKR
jgi:hypothetical protein